MTREQQIAQKWLDQLGYFSNSEPYMTVKAALPRLLEALGSQAPISSPAPEAMEQPADAPATHEGDTQ